MKEEVKSTICQPVEAGDEVSKEVVVSSYFDNLLEEIRAISQYSTTHLNGSFILIIVFFIQAIPPYMKYKTTVMLPLICSLKCISIKQTIYM